MTDTTTQAAEALTAAAAAVTGPTTPDRAAVQSGPNPWTLAALVLAGPAISAMLMWVVWLIVFRLWPQVVGWERVDLASQIIQTLGFLSIGLAGLLGIVVFRLASGGLKSVSAKALSGSIDIQTSDD